MDEAKDRRELFDVITPITEVTVYSRNKDEITCTYAYSHFFLSKSQKRSERAFSSTQDPSEEWCVCLCGG